MGLLTLTLVVDEKLGGASAAASGAPTFVSLFG